MSKQSWRKTFGLDLFQAFPHGAVETMTATFAIVIANKVFEFGTVEKIALTAASAMGFFVSLFVVPIVRRLGLSVNIASAGIWSLGALGFLLAGLGKSSGMLFLMGAVAGMLSLTVATPLISNAMVSPDVCATKGSGLRAA